MNYKEKNFLGKKIHTQCIMQKTMIDRPIHLDSKDYDLFENKIEL